MPDMDFPNTVGSIVTGVAGDVLNGKPDARTISIIAGEGGQLIPGCRRNAGADQRDNSAGIGLRLSLEMTILPKSSTLRTISVAFIYNRSF